ncbi:HlyD family type I secretion periplasmic adaptor subunit [Rhodoblastus acidophilus]|uniref:Membrane fusion protein (MFP) family protein n=1 Tax=Candidatus Rhodoblastus alkanivorans TaxID=2954117 RepID=A0ABS9Z457_9HYPH|nr:HlyD family type I secretion periplasmic adaptor subunit [Candidatus Rhodoblastus alkanivorans]MCI4680827.1 HlyD family type I secretion periplasmic adaptor subunit [Candidatus Rhodoblastus alkanivorans]MCI4682251.1 HlyD family type I secretion periplasmic adaptor subunit [Candidatus Rhodoblastus alkanivorans]MDI4639553.1 HlyD family type I secretion periplasmic adaptor subunit [Rhodoblastus acidophilus]
MKKSSAKIVPFEERRNRRDPTLPVLLEFQKPSTAIVNAPVPRSAQGVIWVIAGMVLTLILVTGVMPVDRVVTAKGTVVSQSPTILVQPLQTSIVRSIDVHEGEEVRAGQLLAKLDPTFAAADFASLKAQASALEAKVARLTAEGDGTPFTYSGAKADWALEASIYRQRKAEFDAKTENFAHRLGELDAQIARAKSDIGGFQERLRVAQAVEQMRATLQAKQVGTKLNTLIAEDNRAEMARSLASAEHAEVEATLGKQALAAEQEAFVSGWKAQIAEQLSEAKDKAVADREQLRKAKLLRNLVEFRAERNAIVQSVAKVSVGSVLQSGQQFITLVPTDAVLQVEADIPGGESGFVHVNDPVAIKFDTFPYSQYGMAEGAVQIVSPSSFTIHEEARNPSGRAPERNGPELFYRARINFTRLSLHGVPAGFHLISGMPVTADIKVGKRTVLQYLLGAVMPVAHEAMREP